MATEVVEWPDSMLYLNNLKVLEGPLVLKKLPRTLHLSSLEKLDLSYRKIEMLPEIIGSIRKLDIRRTNIKEFPPWIIHLSSLVELEMSFCNEHGTLPNNFGLLICLEKLRLTGCKELFKGPLTLSGLNSIKYLYLDGCGLREFPAWVCSLSSLQVLSLSDNGFKSVPDSIRQLSSLKALNLSDCGNLRSLPAGFPCQISHLNVSNCVLLEIESSSFITEVGLIRKPQAYDYRFLLFHKFRFVGCKSLGEGARRDIVKNAMIRIQRMANSMEGLRSLLTVDLPGNEIPEFFKSSEGASITVELPTNQRNSMFRGFVLCVIMDGGSYVELKCEFRDMKGSYLGSYCDDFILGEYVESRILCLQYSPSREISQRFRENHEDATHASFDLKIPNSDKKVLKCGVSLVYAEFEDGNH